MATDLTTLILEHGKENDGTQFPYWMVAIKAGFHGYVPISSGFWFSRKSAEDHLKAKAHRYPKTAVVYCFSGHDSWHVRELYALARAAKEGNYGSVS